MQLVSHESTVRENTIITASSKAGAFFVRIRTCGVVTYEEKWSRATRARERFERVVEEHEV